MTEFFGFIAEVFKFIISVFENISGFILSLGLKAYFLKFNSFLYENLQFLGDADLIKFTLFSIYFIIVSTLISYFMSGNFMFIFKNLSLYIFFVVCYFIFHCITSGGGVWTYILSAIAFIFVGSRVISNIHDNLLKREVKIVAKKILENQSKEKR